MEHIVHRNGSDYYHSQSEFQSNMSFDNNNRSMPNVIMSPGLNKTRPVSQLDEKWKTSSPLLNSSDKNGWKTSSSQGNKSVESWKMSAKPRHAQLPHIMNDDSNFRRHSAMPDMMSTGFRPKPLPQEPIATPAMHMSEPFNLNLPPPPPPNNDISNNPPAPFHLNTPAFIQPNQFQEFSSPIQTHMNNNSYSSPYLHNEMMYTVSNVMEYPPPMTHNQPPLPIPPPQQQPIVNDPAMYSPPSLAPSSSSSTSQQQQDHSPPKLVSKDDKKNKKAEKRQITVQSINPEHRVWIDVLPNETGKSLAEKIHIIATFRTRKIVSITSASGRKIPIDNRPVFGNWTDMEKFEDGERWSVEWRANDKSVVDRFFSKVVQVKALLSISLTTKKNY